MIRSDNGNRILPEMEILLWSIRVDGKGNDSARALLQSNIDWPELTRMARAHQMSAFLYRRLKELPDSGCSAETEQYFGEDYRVNFRRNLFYARQLIWILHMFSQRGIEVIPFKGIVLAHQAYPIPDVRQSGDIDILIRQEDLPQVVEVLQGMGFSPRNPFSRQLIPHFIHSVMRSESFCAPPHADIDVHWAISDIFSGYPAKKKFFRDARTVSLLGSDIPALSPEDTLIMLSAHGMKHFWYGLRSVADIINLIAYNSALDLPLALTTAKDLGCLRLLTISLHLAQMMGGGTYSPTVQAELERDPESYQIARYICNRLQQNGSPEPARRLITMMRSRERRGGALGFGLYALLSWPRPEGLRIRLPRPLRPLYIPFSLFRSVFSR